MTRTAGTINGGNAKTLLGVIHTAITAEPGWSHIETFTNTPSTDDECRVYKLAAATSGLSADFFVAFFVDASDSLTKLFSTVSEEYVATTTRFAKYVPFSTTSPPVNADATAGAPYNGTNNLSTTTLQSYMFPLYWIDCPVTTFDYQISVTDKRVIVASSVVGVNCGVYLGAYENFVQIANNFPICAINLTTTNDAGNVSSNRTYQGGFTRHPGRESQAANTYHFTAGGGSAPTKAWTYYAKVATSGNNSPDKFLNGALASRIIAGTGGISTGSKEIYGHLRGLLIDVININADAGVVPGDTFSFGANTYDVVCRYSVAAGTDVMLIKQGV